MYMCYNASIMKDKKQKSTSFLEQVESLQEPQRTKIKAAVSELILLQLTDRLGDQLTEAQAEEFQRVAEESESTGQAMDWLAERVPALTEIRDEVIADVDASLSEQLGGAGGAQ